ncbi:MAG TPA: hypothetical protein DDY26_04335 [Moraxellaceae bacterium]|nr:hypothetical protein [Moraxellaceae bacterium]
MTMSWSTCGGLTIGLSAGFDSLGNGLIGCSTGFLAIGFSIGFSTVFSIGLLMGFSIGFSFGFSASFSMRFSVGFSTGLGSCFIGCCSAVTAISLGLSAAGGGAIKLISNGGVTLGGLISGVAMFAKLIATILCKLNTPISANVPDFLSNMLLISFEKWAWLKLA